MKKKDFYDKEQARSYLTNSMVRVDGRAVWVVDVQRKSWRGKYHLFVVYNDLEDPKKEGTVRIGSFRLDLNPVPLGLFDYQGRLMYATRMPARRWKIGLSSSNCGILHCYPRNQDYYFYDGPRLSNVLTSKGLCRTVEGKFPSIQEAVEISGAGGGAQAFSRRFGVSNGEDLIYKAMKSFVGKVKHQERKTIPVLTPRFGFLTEALAEDTRV